MFSSIKCNDFYSIYQLLSLAKHRSISWLSLKWSVSGLTDSDFKGNRAKNKLYLIIILYSSQRVDFTQQTVEKYLKAYIRRWIYTCVYVIEFSIVVP